MYVLGVCVIAISVLCPVVHRAAVAVRYTHRFTNRVFMTHTWIVYTFLHALLQTEYGYMYNCNILLTHRLMVPRVHAAYQKLKSDKVFQLSLF